MSERLPLPIDLLPHRGIALVLDELVELEAGVGATGLWTPDERYFEGHFPEPDGPVLPGHWTEESLRLVGCCAIIARYPGAQPRIREDHAIFTRPVLPGDTLKLSVKFERARQTVLADKATGGQLNGLFATGAGEAAVNGEVAYKSKLTKAFFILP